MKNQVIGKALDNGWAGMVSRQPDDITDTHILGGTDNVKFGTAMVYNSDKKVVPFGATNVANDFVGIAAAVVKSAVDYANQSEGKYEPGDAVSVMKRGCVNVICNVGTPALGGDVYIRIEANPDKPTGVIGGFEAEDDTYTPSGETDPVSRMVKLTNVQWKTSKDGNGVAEVRILTCNKA